MDRSIRTRGAIALIALGLVAVACGGGAATNAPTASAAAATIAVKLQEWAIVPAVTTTNAGSVTFAVTNDGPEDVHEFVIVKTDLDAAALPVDENGVVSEEGEGIEVIDEIEDLAVGATQDVTVTLEAGNYVLLCNIYTADEMEAHYRLGMRTSFTVTE